MLRCYPESSHPNAPLDIAATAKRFGVRVEQVHAWLSAGLSIDEDSRIDPFECCNWLSWGPLDTAPALRRLWRQFLSHFRPFIKAKEQAKHLIWKRESVVHLPMDVEHVHWYIPRMQEHFDWQSSKQLEQLSLNAQQQQLSEHQDYWEVELSHPQPHASITYDVYINPQRNLTEADAEYQELFQLFCLIIDSFDYHYRVHELDDRVRADVLKGTCLDCALYTAALLEDKGRAWRLCGGVIAHNALLNAHHWLEVETTKGWIPFDATIPAIARMLGEDWQLWARHYCGGLDAGRITLTQGPGYWDVPEQNFISAATGAVKAEVNGEWLNAWPCLDWVCGECDGSIQNP